MRIHVPYTTCDVISLNGQRQLCQLSCVEWRELLNHTRMSTIQSRSPHKKAKNYVTLTRKFPWKSIFTTHLPFVSSSPKILKTLTRNFPPEMKPTKYPGKKVSRLLYHIKPPKISKFCVLRMPELRKVIFSIRIRRPCKRLCGTFSLFIARTWPGESSTGIKTRFSVIFPRARFLIIHTVEPPLSGQ